MIKKITILLFSILIVGCGSSNTTENMLSNIESNGYNIEYDNEYFETVVIRDDDELISFTLQNNKVYRIIYNIVYDNSIDDISGVVYGSDINKKAKELYDEFLSSINSTDDEMIEFVETYYEENK